jgi:hypothetical protein
MALLAATSIMAAPAGIHPRQGAGTGNACSSLLSSTDNGVGYGVENAEDNTAALLGKPASQPGAGTKLTRRQGDKMANGAAAVLNAAGQPALANIVKTNGDTLDGQLTDGQTQIGAELGSDEQNLLEQVGAEVP